MKLRFAHGQIKEYSNGPLHYRNDGGEIVVTATLASELLGARHLLDGEWVNVFEVDAGGKAPKKAEAGELLATYPADFPSAEALAAAGHAHDEAVLLDEAALTGIDGIGKKTAKAILDFHNTNINADDHTEK